MTVTTITGSELSEVWGDAFNKSKKKRSGGRGGADCDSLVKKPPPFDDIMNDFYHPSIHGIYEKSRFARDQHALADTDADGPREDEDKYVSVGPSPEMPEQSIAPANAYAYQLQDAARRTQPQAQSQSQQPMQQQPQQNEHYTEPKHLMMLNDDREKRYLDLSMYVFSGVALIFILEQFIHLGLLLKS